MENKLNRQSLSQPSHEKPYLDGGATVLIVDDEPAICWAFERLLQEEGHSVLKASSAEDGLKIASEIPLDMVLLDVRLPKEDGISALPKFLAATKNAPIVIMTAFGDLETAVAAVRNGAIDYLVKPFLLSDAIRTCRNALRTRAQQSQNDGLSLLESPNRGEIIGRSIAIQQVFRQIALFAECDLSVLITGETGTGKELVAAAIHRHSRRAQAPYLPIAPVTFNLELVESELFGHVKGAFTGASDDRAGLFEQAEGGTILLDEIGDLPLGTQAKLLRVLEQGDYCRVGDVRLRRCNVRILAATNGDLRQLVKEGRFREDLFYRLNGLHICLPPLRERLADLGSLCEYFLERAGYPNASIAMNNVVLEALAKRPWHGNVRELRNAIQYAALAARGRPLVLDDFPTFLPSREACSSSAKSDLDNAVVAFVHELLDQSGLDSTGVHDKMLAAFEPAMIEIVLRHAGGNRNRAAEILGIHRGTLRERLRHYKLEE